MSVPIRTLALLGALGVSVAIAPPASAQCPYNFATEWGGLGTEPGRLNLPYDLALAPDGGILVADYRNDRIQKFDRDGNVLLHFGSSGTDPGQFRRPWGLAVDGGGNIYVVEHLVFRVQKFSPSGVLLTSWALPGEGLYQDIISIAADATGNLYVPDPSERTMYKFGPSGTLLGQWTSGDPDWFPPGVTVDEDGALYVYDANSYLVLDTNLATQQPKTPFSGGVSLNVRGGRFYVPDVAERIIRVSLEGGPELCTMGEPGAGPGQFDLPLHALPAPDGSVYGLDTVQSKVLRFDAATVSAQPTTWGRTKATYR